MSTKLVISLAATTHEKEQHDIMQITSVLMILNQSDVKRQNTLDCLDQFMTRNGFVFTLWDKPNI